MTDYKEALKDISKINCHNDALDFYIRHEATIRKALSAMDRMEEMKMDMYTGEYDFRFIIGYKTAIDDAIQLKDRG